VVDVLVNEGIAIKLLKNEILDGTTGIREPKPEYKRAELQYD
jgi:hypothetical protein